MMPASFHGTPSPAIRREKSSALRDLNVQQPCAEAPPDVLMRSTRGPWCKASSIVASRYLDDLAAGSPDHYRVTDLPVDQRLR